MNAIYLSGESIKNKDWIYELQSELSPLFAESIIQNYAHWGTDSAKIDLSNELSTLKNIASSINDYMIIAKSIGTVLSAEAISKKIINPQKCVFMGVPINIINKSGLKFAEFLYSVKCPILFMQNRNDPVGKYHQLIEYLNKLRLSNLQYKVVEFSGDTHDYTDYKILYKLIKQFIEP